MIFDVVFIWKSYIIHDNFYFEGTNAMGVKKIEIDQYLTYIYMYIVYFISEEACRFVYCLHHAKALYLSKSSFLFNNNTMSFRFQVFFFTLGYN